MKASGGLHLRKGGMAMARGTIRRWLEYRGFGFIHSEDDHDIFFHRSEVLGVPFRTLREGLVVEFMVEATPQGPKARCVRVITEARSMPLGASH